MALTNLAHFVVIPAPQHLATMSLIQPTMCTHRIWCLSLIRTHINTLDCILRLVDFSFFLRGGGWLFWRTMRYSLRGTRRPWPRRTRAEAARIYGWISGQLAAGRVALLNGGVFIWIKLPARPHESADAELWHRRSRRPRGGSRGSQLKMLSCPLATLHIQMSPCLSPRFAL